MGRGRRQHDRQQEFWIATDALASVPQHIFADKLNRLLDEAGFDEFVEELCAPFSSSRGSRSCWTLLGVRNCWLEKRWVSTPRLWKRTPR